MPRRLSDTEVRRLFLAERALFARTFPEVAKVGLVLVDEHYEPNPTPRDVAWFDLNEHAIYLVRYALEREPDCLRGVFRHEFGHVADERIHEPGCERRADRLAEYATGSPILYTREGIQHVSRGVPRRPDWLHQ